MARRLRGIPAFVLLFGASVSMLAAGLTLPQSGDNQQSTVIQSIGPVSVKIEYSSPRVVRGTNDRKGKIWGELVPWGMSDLQANGCKECPWRAGANENTLFTVSHDVKVQGQPLAAGTYGFHLIPGQDEWTAIFSKDINSWGSFWYDPSHDVLRVKTKAGKSEYHEFLTYEFTEREPAKATVALKWEELAIPLTVTVDNVKDLWVAQMRNELHGFTGFNWQSWRQAAAYCAQNKVNLPEALTWAQRAVSDPFAGGQENFQTLATLAQLQELNGQGPEAAKTFEKALNHRTADPVQIHLAARQLMTAGKKDEAIRVYAFNAKRFPNEWPVHVGLMRSYAAQGDKKKAIAEGKLAVVQAPDDGNKKNLERMIKQLESGGEIN